ncbi:MAG TPA: glycosyltransferase, partial [Tabrizicola sp.]|nr:glycosyltransferase [Tabrizicola sp.]
MTADGSPAVTVGMAILNDARTLERAIASVLAQDFQRWRLIISDDGSTDGSDRIAESAAARDDRITLIRQSTRQGPMNFRAPLDLAGTPFFVWLSAGDRWHPQFLALTVQALSAAAPAVSALPQAAWIGPPERPIPNLGFLKGSASGRVRRYLASPDDTRIFGLMRTELLQRAFPQEPFHGFELYLMARLLAKGAQLYVPQTLLFRDAATASDRARRHAAGTGVPRKLPAWPLSRHLIRDRALPLGALPALVRLNLAARADPNFFRPLPDADTASAMARPAPDTPPKVAPTAPQSRHAGTEPLITAILPFRNAASTLAAVLKHLHALDCRIIAIDHGSTDGSRAIAEAAGVDQLVHDPWTGFQDLTRQLRMRQHLIASA